MERRDFIKAVGVGGIVGLSGLSAFAQKSGAANKSARQCPNILWISMEDTSTRLGCYGDSYATTPNIDRLAGEGIRYTNAYAIGSLCAPSRASIITGMYASTVGLQDQRSWIQAPDFLRFLFQYFQQAGYFCTNNAKTDYNMLVRPHDWDEDGTFAHWRHRKPGQPFFSVFNQEESHSSVTGMPLEKARKERLFLLSEKEFHDPGRAPIPPHYPDTPGVRQGIAQTYDAITQVDHHVGELIDALKEDGLYEDTIIVFWGDHGGFWHGKTLLYDESVHVPLIVRFPKKYRHLAPGDPGTVTDRIVTLMDLGPSMLNLAGLPIPDYIQGEPFLGPNLPTARPYAVAIRDRCGFAHEFSRSLRDKRYRYIRNFYPHWPYGWWFGVIPTTGDVGAAATHIPLPPQSPVDKPDILIWQGTKPAEELYDAINDPDMIHNLADSPEHKQIRDTMRESLYRWMVETRDLGLIYPLEREERAVGSTPYDVGLRCENFARLLETADLSRLGPATLPTLLKRMEDPDGAVRYWAVTGLTTLHADDEATVSKLRAALKDTSLSVRLAAADAMCRLGLQNEAVPVLQEGLDHPEASELARARAACIIAAQNEEGRRKMKELFPALDRARFYQLENRWNLQIYEKAFFNIKHVL